MQDEWWLVQMANGQPVSAKHIVDPQSWGAIWPDVTEPGSSAYTGQGIFLADGSLIGTAAHLWDCGSGAKHNDGTICEKTLCAFRYIFVSKVFIGGRDASIHDS